MARIMAECLALCNVRLTMPTAKHGIRATAKAAHRAVRAARQAREEILGS